MARLPTLFIKIIITIICNLLSHLSVRIILTCPTESLLEICLLCQVIPLNIKYLDILCYLFRHFYNFPHEGLVHFYMFYFLKTYCFYFCCDWGPFFTTVLICYYQYKEWNWCKCADSYPQPCWILTNSINTSIGSPEFSMYYRITYIKYTVLV